MVCFERYPNGIPLVGSKSLGEGCTLTEFQCFEKRGDFCPETRTKLKSSTDDETLRVQINAITSKRTIAGEPSKDALVGKRSKGCWSEARCIKTTRI